MAQRYGHWFPKSGAEFAQLSTQTCNATLNAYLTAARQPGMQAAFGLGVNNDNPVYQLCDDHASCILNNSTEWVKANMSVSNLILGLLPTILAVVAPSLTEMAVLGVHRPILSALLSVSSPAVLQGRVFTFESPGEVLSVEHPSHDIRHPLTIGPWSPRTSTIAGICGYVLAAGALLNTLTLVTQLTNNSILAWGCTRTWPLFVWMFVPALIHILATTGYYLTLKETGNDRTNRSFSSAAEQEIPMHTIVNKGKTVDRASSYPGPEPEAPPEKIQHRMLHHRLRDEFMSCASHLQPYYENRHKSRPNDLRAGIVLNGIAGFMGFLHLVFATVVFSALLFIVPLDAIGQIAMRFLLSALVCRFVVMFEIAGLRGKHCGSGNEDVGSSGSHRAQRETLAEPSPAFHSRRAFARLDSSS